MHQARSHHPARDADPPSLGEYLALYRRLIGARARSQMQYRASFWLAAVGNVAVTLGDFVAIAVFFNRVPQLAGWSLGEVAMIYGLAFAAFGLAETFARGFDLFYRQILQGSFDRILTRPLSAFFQVLSTDLPLQKVGRFIQGAAVFGIAAHSVGVHWTLSKALVLLVTVPSGTVIFFSIFIIGGAASFWTVQANEAVNIFTNGGVTMLSYPMDIYHVPLRHFVTFVIPLAFVSYYPCLYLLDRPDPLGFPPWIAFLAPLAALLFASLASLIWSIGVRRYTSVGN